MIELVRLAISLILATTFLLSGVAKLRSGRFVADLANYRILPAHAVVRVATMVPYLEVALAALLLTLPTSPVPVFLAAAALTIFAAAMIVNLVRGRTIACGCRGSDKPISWTLAAANLILASVACAVASYRPEVGELKTLDAIATAGCVAVAGLAVRLDQQLRQIRSAMRMLGLNVRQGAP